MSSKSADESPIGSFKEVEALAPQEVATLIQAKDVPEPVVRAWTLNNLADEARQKAQQTQRAAYDELQQKMQPEILRQTELLKKEAYEQAKKEGFDAGYAEGQALGQQEAREIALAEAQSALAEKLETMQALLNALSTPYDLLEKKVFESLTKLTLQLAEEVIEQQIEQEPKWLAKIVEQSVTSLQDSMSPLEVLLHPHDKALLEEAGLAVSKQWRLTADDEVMQGTCQVKQGFSTVEHNWRNRFANMTVMLEAQAVADMPKHYPPEPAGSESDEAPPHLKAKADKDTETSTSDPSSVG
jgi:flagellar assembly protein FliH